MDRYCFNSIAHSCYEILAATLCKQLLEMLLILLKRVKQNVVRIRKCLVQSGCSLTDSDVYDCRGRKLRLAKVFGTPAGKTSLLLAQQMTVDVPPLQYAHLITPKYLVIWLFPGRALVFKAALNALTYRRIVWSTCPVLASSFRKCSR